MRLAFLLSCMSLMPLAHAADLSSCVGIESDEERLRCYDELAMRSAPSSPEAPVAAVPPPAPELSSTQEPAPAPVPKAAPAQSSATPEELFGKSDEAKNAAIAEAAGVEDVSSISTSVTSVARDAYGKATIRLDNGQRWRQVRAERFDVDVGDEVVIKRAVFGSFTLQKKSGGKKTKVRRVD